MTERKVRGWSSDRKDGDAGGGYVEVEIILTPLFAVVFGFGWSDAASGCICKVQKAENGGG